MRKICKAEETVRVCLISAAILALFTLQVSAEPNATESRIKVGVLSLEPYGEAGGVAGKVTEELIASLKEIGFYDVYNQNMIEEALNLVKKRMPSHCRDPRCVLDIGKTTGMDRMIYGSIDLYDNRYGIKLSLIDMLMRRTVESVSIQGAPGVSVSEVLKTAVARLHGNPVNEAKSDIYYGPKVHNEKQLIFSAAGVIGAGLIYGLVNYASGGDGAGRISGEYPSSGEDRSGIASSADQIAFFGRPAAMANAYVAESDDAYGVLYNPAGMAWVAGAEMALAYQYRFGFIDNLAATYVNKATREIGFGHAFLYSSDRGENLFTEIYFVSAFAYKFLNLPSFIRPFSLGVNLKLVSNRARGNDEYSISGSSFGAGIDLGFMWELADNIRYGLLLRDVPVVNRWKNISTGKSYFEPHASTLHMGGIFEAGYSTFLIAEGQIPLYRDQVWKMSGGIEQEIFKFMVLRAGVQKEIQSTRETPWKLTGGFGVKVNSIELDGSYEYNTLRLFDVIDVSVKVVF